MQKGLTKILFLLITTIAVAQPVVCTDLDRTIFAEKAAEMKELKPGSEALITSIGKSFLGTTYVAQTLEINEEEKLVINLREFDCTTYVENVLTLSLMAKRETYDFETFTNLLRNIRYRDGELNGYGSRLHYFTEWIADNTKKGLVKDITADLGGLPVNKEINFMSTHRDLYPMLKDDANYESILQAENRMNQHSVYFVPQDQVANIEDRIEDGDIIALATSIKGLDVTHTGYAIRQESGRIHLLHASSSGQVEISKKPLAEYLKGVKRNTGIIVARPN